MSNGRNPLRASDLLIALLDMVSDKVLNGTKHICMSEKKRFSAGQVCIYGYTKMKNLDLIAFVLLLIGGLNWGLVAAFNYNLVTSLLGDSSMMTKVVYGVIGLCALQQAYQHFL